jgi:hypothetical protein
MTDVVVEVQTGRVVVGASFEASVVRSNARRMTEEVQSPTRPPPPRQARLLLRYALPLKHQEDLIGDLEEEYYTRWLPEEGLREARRLYWSHAIRSIAPMLWTAVKTSGIVTLILGAADWLRDRFG